METDGHDGDLLVVAGEASGDLHGARLVSALRDLGFSAPVFGVGGHELVAAGMDRIADSSEISVVGISEVVRVLPRARQIFRQILQEVDRRRARTAILVDFPDFNLRLAKALHRRGVRVLYYISPQIWAWRRGRVRIIEKLVDRMLVILPFEVDFYRRHGVDAVHVGHPLVDEVPKRPQRWDRSEADDGVRVISLLPGSRESEIAANLPVMLGAAKLLSATGDYEFRLIKAASIDDSTLNGALQDSNLDLDIVREDRFTAVADSHLAICASGTATLEVGLLGTPMVMVYRVSSWTYFVGRLLVRLPHIALVNLVLGKRAIPELLQDDANPAQIAATATAILRDRDRIRSMRSDLGRLRHRLGESGASRRAAEQVMAELSAGSSG